MTEMKREFTRREVGADGNLGIDHALIVGPRKLG